MEQRSAMIPNAQTLSLSASRTGMNTSPLSMPLSSSSSAGGLTPHQLLRLQQIQRQRLQIQLVRAKALHGSGGDGKPSPADRMAAAILLRRTLQASSAASVATATSHQYNQALPSLASSMSLQPSRDDLRWQVMAAQSKSSPIDLTVDHDQPPPHLVLPPSLYGSTAGSLSSQAPGFALDSSMSSSSSSASADLREVPMMKVPIAKKKQVHKKKCKDKPRRALSAYNIFFKEERQRILGQIPGKTESASDDNVEGDGPQRRKQRHGKIGFENLARLIGQRWQDVGPEQIKYYKGLAEADKVRYQTEMEAYSKTTAQMSSSLSSCPELATEPNDFDN